MVYQLWKWWFTMVNTTILPTISTSKSVCPARWRNAGLVGRALWPQSVFRDGSSKNGGAMGISWGYFTTAGCCSICLDIMYKMNVFTR